MALYYVGLVAPVDYPALYALCDGRLPDTFEEWRIIEDLTRRELVAAGHHVIGRHIDVVDLRDYCRANRIRTDTAALHALATETGNREFATQREYALLREQTVVVEDIRTGTVAEEEAVGGPLVRARRRHWWQRGRRPTVVAPADAAIDRTLVVDAPRRHWWQFWRRPTVVVPADATIAVVTEADIAKRPIVVDAPRRRYARVA